MYKWIGITLAIIGFIWVGSMRSRWPKPSKGIICNDIPKFENYLENIDGKILTSVDLDSNKMAKEEMERELLVATGSAVNFAGKYVIINHECGLGCQKHAVVDTNSTKIVDYGLQTSKIFKLQPNSRLIIADNRYYELRNNEMNYLCETEK